MINSFKIVVLSMTVGTLLSQGAVAEAAAKSDVDLPTPAYQSKVGQAVCPNGQTYWSQRRRSADGQKMCTTYQWNKFESISIGWKPEWNCPASKYYCKDTAKDPCFDSESACH